MYGYHGKVLKINLTDLTNEVEFFDESFAKIFLGGNGFAAKYIYDMVPENSTPFSKENIVVFATGPFNGSPIWGTSRGHVASISPLTNFFFDSNFGGDFAAALKNSGYDVVIVSGKAKSPVYISINNGKVEIKDASNLWGKTTGESHKLLQQEEGPDVESAVIGPAGENKDLYSSIICSGKRISAAGRGGVASVLGSKNCKGLAVQGKIKIDIFNKKNLIKEIRKETKYLREAGKALTTYGTPVLVDIINNKGKMVTQNNNGEVFEKAAQINGETILKTYTEKNIACKGCPIACGKLVKVTDGKFKGESVKMPEYETLYALGSMLNNGDINSIFNANTECDEMGIDTISFGVTLAFLIECKEKGIYTPEKDEFDIVFGDSPNLSDIVKIASLKEGETGRLLSLGSKKIAEKLGNDADKLLYAVKGLELPGHSARGLRNMSLGYAVSTRGGSHHDTRPKYYANDPEVDPGFENQAIDTIESQHNTTLGDTLVLCRFIQERVMGMEITESYLPYINNITGWEMTLSELKLVAERIYNLEKLVIRKFGADRKDDSLPYRVMNEPIPAGPSKGFYCPEEELNKMIDEYYSLRGWDDNGNITENKSKELGLV